MSAHLVHQDNGKERSEEINHSYHCSGHILFDSNLTEDCCGIVPTKERACSDLSEGMLTHMITFMPVNCWKSCSHTPMSTLGGIRASHNIIECVVYL